MSKSIASYFSLGTPSSASDSVNPNLTQLSTSSIVATAITPNMPNEFTPASLLTAPRLHDNHPPLGQNHVMRTDRPRWRTRRMFPTTPTHLRRLL